MAGAQGLVHEIGKRHAEGLGKGSQVNEWYSDTKVSKNKDVVSSLRHSTTISAKDNAATHTKVNPHSLSTDDIEILVALGITMVPVLKKEFLDLKNACIAKNIEWKVKNMKIILSKFLLSIIKRVNEIDEALIQKGHVQN